MAEIKMLVFDKGSSQEICSLITNKLAGREEVLLCFAY
jgi:hypothetical protein